MATFRYDVVKDAAEWVIATGGPSWRGHPTKAAAIAAATEAARRLEAKGNTVEVYVWDGQVSTKVHETPPPK